MGERPPDAADGPIGLYLHAPVEGLRTKNVTQNWMKENLWTTRTRIPLVSPCIAELYIDGTAHICMHFECTTGMPFCV